MDNIFQAGSPLSTQMWCQRKDRWRNIGPSRTLEVLIPIGTVKSAIKSAVKTDNVGADNVGAVLRSPFEPWPRYRPLRRNGAFYRR